MLEQHLPGVVKQIEVACMGQADLIPYAVRQALNDGLGGCASEPLIAHLKGLPASEQTYTRHVLHADHAGRFTVVALVWQTQQFSPVHAHHSWCAYRVVAGELTESHYEWDRAQERAYLFNKVVRRAGESICGHAGLELIHRLGNAAGEPAISIHTYGVDAERISTHVNRILPWSEKTVTV
jgi:predicted metal-dependent enzyme (double-stranded beta helix superfamily)